MFGFLKKRKHEVEAQAEDIQPVPVKDEPIPTPEVVEAIDDSPEFAGPVLDEQGNPIEFPPLDLKFNVTSDGMQAYVKVKMIDDRQPLTSAQVIEFIEKNGVVHGIDRVAIKKFCKKRDFVAELVVASGTPPIVGDPASIEYFFKVPSEDDNISFIENDQGKVDYRELNAIQSSKADQVLCTLTPETSGIAGTNVMGSTVPPKPGKALDLKFGENTKLSEDKLSVLSAIDGCIEYNKNGTVSISGLFTVRGDVNSGVGNLNCTGSIVINGDVREGFVVKATNDVVVKGIVEGAHIIAGGNVTISNGMNGMNFGEIVAGGNVVSKYLENAVITSEGGSVYSDVIINCKTTAKESVILKGGKGSLIGGSCTAGKMVYANAIGAHTNVPTSVTIDSSELRDDLIPDSENAKKKQMLDADLTNMTSDCEELKKLISAIGQPADNKAADRLKQASASLAKKTEEIAKINQAIKDLESASSPLGQYKILALKMCYSGVKLTMAYLYMHIDTDYSNTKFFISDHKLTAGQVLPSDKIK